MSQALIMPGSASLDPDSALVAAAQERPATFEALYSLYLPRIYRFLRARADSDDEAADLTQVVFLKAFDALPGYRPGKAPFAAWLFKIARNTATDAHRRRRTNVALDLVPDQEAPGAETPDEAAIRGEQIQRLRQLVGRLDPAKQELLALRFAGGLSSREIALVVGKSEQAVKRQLTRILVNLKEQCDEDLR